MDILKVKVGNEWVGVPSLTPSILDVKINGASIKTGGVANIPIASGNDAGVSKVNTAYGLQMITNSDNIAVQMASASEIKSATNYYKPVVPASIHQAAFYGLAKAAGDSTQAASSNAVGTYTDDAKSAIRTMIGAASPVDIQINGTSIVNNGVANIPVMTGSSLGIARTDGGFGTAMSSNNAIVIVAATDLNVKAGSDSYRPIVPKTQHASTFYGLTKAAGVDMSSSNNAVGTYTDAAKSAIRTMIGAAEPVDLDGAGYITKTYTPVTGGEFSVTTAAVSGHPKPYGSVTISGLPNEMLHLSQYKFRVTYNGTVYELPCRKVMYISSRTSETYNTGIYTYIGDVRYYFSNPSGITSEYDEAPFCIVFGYVSSSTVEVVTSEAITANILIEKRETTSKPLPKELIFNNEDFLIKQIKINNASYGLDALSIGSNKITSEGGISIGYANEVIGGFSTAIGYGNIASGHMCISCGSGSTASGNNSHAEGFTTTASGDSTHAEGTRSVASGAFAHAEGYETTASGQAAHAEGAYSIASAQAAHAEGGYTEASENYSHAEGYRCYSSGKYAHSEGSNNFAKANISHVEGAGNEIYDTQKLVHVSGVNCLSPNSTGATITYLKKLSDGTTTGNPVSVVLGSYAEIIGNGTADDARSNARALDWDGNEHLKGYLYVGCNTDSTGGTRVPHDIQVDGVSVVVNGVANVPVAGNGNAATSTLGVVRGGYGIKITSGGTLNTDYAYVNDIKNGTSNYLTIAPSTVPAATFYGLSKVAGVDLKDETVTLGTYPDSSKAAIRNMLGVESTTSLVETVSGTTPTIVGQPNVRYVCGSVTLIDITPPAAGTIDVIFESGSTPAVMTVPNTVKFPAWFDATSLEANTVYEIMITDGVYGAVMSWAS